MPVFTLPNSAALHNIRSFLASNSSLNDDGGEFRVVFHPKWSHVEPVALAMVAAWGARARANGHELVVDGVEKEKYAARMGLFDFLGVEHGHVIVEREAAGRFMPLAQVTDSSSASSVIGDISALLHLHEEPETLKAVQYCVSELLRNVLEHSGSQEGAFVCAHRYDKSSAPRVSIAIGDAGMGIRSHLSRAHQIPHDSDMGALGLAMMPGITGALKGAYGTPDNAGAGLFMTRCIAKGSGGYFFTLSGNAAYRLRRTNDNDQQAFLWREPFSEVCNQWEFGHAWRGTVVALEIRTDRIEDFGGYISWIRKHMPTRRSTSAKVNFT